MTRDHDPERLQRRIEQAQYHEAEIQAKRQREAEGAAEWVAKHKGQQSLPIRRNDGPIRDRTVSEIPR